jgi:hypothetical protein
MAKQNHPRRATFSTRSESTPLVAQILLTRRLFANLGENATADLTSVPSQASLASRGVFSDDTHGVIRIASPTAIATQIIATTDCLRDGSLVNGVTMSTRQMILLRSRGPRETDSRHRPGPRAARNRLPYLHSKPVSAGGVHEITITLGRLHLPPT